MTAPFGERHGGRIDTDAIRADVLLSEILPARHGIPLKRAGKEWKTTCPFHADKTASFTIRNGSKGHEEFKCFGCGVNSGAASMET
jgi:DNA primase